MNRRRFNFSIRNTVGYTTLAAILLVALSIAVPAAAASKNGGGGGGSTMDDCQIAYAVCTKSCVNELDWCQKDCEKKFIVCKPRTHASNASQHAPVTGGVKKDARMPSNGTPTAPPKASDVRAPLGGGGILDGGPGLMTRGPATTGSPLGGARAPAAPPAAGPIIR